MILKSFLIGFLVASSFAVYRAFMIIASEINDPILQKGKDKWILYTSIVMVSVWFLALLILGFNL